jgi:ribosomal protein S24E
MELNIITNEKNELLGRSEIVAEVDQKLIPSRDEVTTNLAAQLNVEKSKIIVQKIANDFGKSKKTITAKVYDSEEVMKNVEREYMLKKNETKEAPKVEAKEEVAAEAVNDVETEKSDVAEQATEEAKAEETVAAEAVEEVKEAAPVEAKAEEAPKSEEPAKEEVKTEEPKVEEKKKDGEN